MERNDPLCKPGTAFPLTPPSPSAGTIQLKPRMNTDEHGWGTRIAQIFTNFEDTFRFMPIRGRISIRGL